jgi:hypothetical protein
MLLLLELWWRTAGSTSEARRRSARRCRRGRTVVGRVFVLILPTATAIATSHG